MPWLKTDFEIGEKVILHGLKAEGLNGETGRIIAAASNDNRFFVYIESGRHEQREIRVRPENLAAIQQADRVLHKGEEHVARDEYDDDDDDDYDESGARTGKTPWTGAIKVAVTLRGLYMKGMEMYNGKRARILSQEGNLIRVRTLEQPGIPGHELTVKPFNIRYLSGVLVDDPKTVQHQSSKQEETDFVSSHRRKERAGVGDSLLGGGFEGQHDSGIPDDKSVMLSSKRQSSGAKHFSHGGAGSEEKGEPWAVSRRSAAALDEKPTNGRDSEQLILYHGKPPRPKHEQLHGRPPPAESTGHLSLQLYRPPVNPANVKCGLALDDGAGKMWIIAPGSSITIGRSRQCTVVLPFTIKTVSSIHADISRSHNDQYELRDTSSSGTMVNGQMVWDRTEPLSDGSVLRFGTSRVHSIFYMRWLDVPMSSAPPGPIPSAFRPDGSDPLAPPRRRAESVFVDRLTAAAADPTAVAAAAAKAALAAATSRSSGKGGRRPATATEGDAGGRRRGGAGDIRPQGAIFTVFLPFRAAFSAVFATNSQGFYRMAQAKFTTTLATYLQCDPEAIKITSVVDVKGRRPGSTAAYAAMVAAAKDRRRTAGAGQAAALTDEQTEVDVEIWFTDVQDAFGAAAALRVEDLCDLVDSKNLPAITAVPRPPRVVEDATIAQAKAAADAVNAAVYAGVTTKAVKGPLTDGSAAEAMAAALTKEYLTTKMAKERERKLKGKGLTDYLKASALISCSRVAQGRDARTDREEFELEKAMDERMNELKRNLAQLSHRETAAGRQQNMIHTQANAAEAARAHAAANWFSKTQAELGHIAAALQSKKPGGDGEEASMAIPAVAAPSAGGGRPTMPTGGNLQGAAAVRAALKSASHV